MTFYDRHGRRLDLAGNGHRGGEGTVHRIAGDASRVAKIYHSNRIGSDLLDKLRVMLAQPPSDPSWAGSRHRSIAWVDGLVFADPSGADLRGFTMPYVDTDEFRQAHVYYDAADRLQLFGGDFTWRHLLYAAHNLASAVSAVHAAGHRVGDLRETNLLVAPSSLVTLIDCDSFQIRDRHTHRVYPTRVATGDYLPPELHGVDFRTQQPDRFHGDLFALAVLVFRFLMLGAHPFQACGAAVKDAPTTEAKIRRGLFAFAGRERGVEPPKYAPAFAILPRDVRELFSRAFIGGHSDPDARPRAAEWVGVLATEGGRLQTCKRNANHSYAHGSRACPWCEISPDPFPARAIVGAQLALPDAVKQIPESVRVEQLRTYARVALVDGPITETEFAHLRASGREIGLKTAVIDRVIDDEARRNGASYRSYQASQPQSAGSGINGHAFRPSAIVHALRSRPRRAAVKAAAPVLVACALAGALAPVLAPAGGAIIALPLLAVIGDARASTGWRERAKLPLRFAIHLHHSVGHAARFFVPVVLLALAVSRIREVPPELALRAAGALGLTILAWFAMSRLPFSAERSAAPLRAGRDAAWRGLVGDSGRMRRTCYVLWAGCLAAAAALANDHGLWWPLG